MKFHSRQQFVIGETWQLDFQCHDNAGNALDLTGATLEWRLNKSDQVTNVFSLTLGSGIQVLDPLSGVAFVTLTPLQQQNASMVPAIYWDELFVTLPNGTVSDQSRGQIEAISRL